MLRDVAIHTVRREEDIEVRVLIRPKVAVRIDGASSGGDDAPPPRVREISCRLNGLEVVSVDAGPSFNEEAYFEFVVHGAQARDNLTVAWTDTAGTRGEGRLTIT